MASTHDLLFTRPDSETLRLLGIAVPQALGGDGHTWVQFDEALRVAVQARPDLGYLMLLVSQSWALKALLDHGTEHQVAAWVPRILQGELVATALAEPQSGTDLAATQTQLTMQEMGWRLDGAKRHISYAGEARLVLCLCKEQPGNAFRLVVLDAAKHGWKAEPSGAKIGLASLPTGDMWFDGLAITADDVLAAGKVALAVLADFMTLGRSLIAVGAAAILQKHLQTTLRFANERLSNGQSIASQQYMQQKLTDIQIQIAQTRLLGEEALRAHLAAEPQAIALGNMAKIAATEAMLTASRSMLSILGTEGFQQGPMAQFAIDALAFQAIGGTEEAHRISLFKQMQRGALGTV